MHLADLDADQVPHALRPVNASSARRLPPPLAAVVVRELDRSDDLRGEVAALLDPDDETLPQKASLAFVVRPEGWEELMDGYGADQTNRVSQAEFDRLTDRIEASEAELAKARDKLKKLRKQASADATEAREKIADLKRQLARAQAPGQEIESKQHELLQAALAEQASLRVRVERAEALVLKLRGNLLRAKRSRGTGQAMPGFDRVGPRPVDLAKTLDALSVIAAVDHVASSEPGAPSPGFGLPPGIRPDSAEAMEWVVKGAGPVTIIIDGYNAAWLIDAGAFSSARVRQEVVRRAGLLRGASVAPSKVIVVFDSEYGASEPPSPGPVAVRWAPSADDEIRSLADTLGGDVVVVSTDREVQEGSALHGAVVLWSEAFVGWTGR